MLTRSSVELLYEQDAALPGTLRYLLHTEPAIPPRRTPPHGRQATASLRWRDPGWVAGFGGDMLLEIEDVLGIPPEIIEIHPPGDRRNTHADIVAGGMHALIAAHWNAFGAEPLVLLEHHKDQSISTGSQMRSFWAVLKDIHPEIAGLAGIALDPWHLHAATREEFPPGSLGEVPLDALQAFHIHNDLRPPSVADGGVPWPQVFEVIGDVKTPPRIKPVVYQKSRVPGGAIAFCEEMLAAPRAVYAGPPA